MRFHSPEWLLLLLVIPFVVWQYVRATTHGTLLFSSIKNVARIRRSRAYYMRHSLLVLRVLAISALALALARPQIGDQTMRLTTEGIDIILTIDTSGSMRAEDLAPGRNRMEVAIDVSKDFVSQRPHDRIGLVVFGEDAFMHCPLTHDTASLLQFLDMIEIGTAGANATAIGDGIAASVLRLNNSDAKSKIIILLTDGVNNSGMISPEDAAEMARTLGIRLYTVGIGTKGAAPVPTRDFFGNVRYIQQWDDIDEEALIRIAEHTGGVYFRAEDLTSLENIYKEIERLEKAEIETVYYVNYSEMFTPFALAGALALIAEILLSHTRFRQIP